MGQTFGLNAKKKIDQNMALVMQQHSMYFGNYDLNVWDHLKKML